MKLAVYSCITNSYDSPKVPVIQNVPHFLFTDNPNIKAPGWKIVEIKKTGDQRLQRKIKILGHEILEPYDVTLYVDGSIQLKSTINQVLKLYRGGLMIGRHPKRNCVYAEGLAVKELGKAPSELVNRQISEYYENDFPVNFGMWAAGFLMKDKSCRQMCELWWEKLSEHTHRDQLSLPWALWKHPVKLATVEMHKYMTIHRHLEQEPPVVHYISPFRSDKNIGKANNDEISKYPDRDWVVLTDADAMPMLPDFGKQIEDIIKLHGHEYGIIGCMTNRLGGLHQCHEGKFSEDFDVRNHYKIALELREKYGTDVIDTTGVAALCMIFNVGVWRKTGGWVENDYCADTHFNKAVKKLGLKIGIAKGLYFFHCYRIWKEGHKEAWNEVTHLK